MAIPHPKRLKLLNLLPLLLALVGMVIFVEHDLDRRHEYLDEQQNQVLQQLTSVRAALESELNRRLYLTQALNSFVAVNGDIDSNQFEMLVAQLLSGGISGIRSIQITEGTRIRHVYPAEDAERLVGLDLLTLPGQAETLRRTMAGHEMVIAGPLELVQGGQAIVARTPIRLGYGTESSEYWGLSTIIIDWPTLLGLAGLDRHDRLGIEVAIRGKDGLGAAGAVIYGNAALFDDAPELLDIKLPTGTWSIAAAPRGGWRTLAPGSRYEWVIGGLLLVLVIGFSMVWLRYPRRLQREVEGATRELQQIRYDLEERVAERTAELSLAKERAEEASREKSLFLSKISHEFRTPLNGVLGFAQMLMLEPAVKENPLLHKMVGNIDDAGSYLLDLVNSLIELGSVDSGNLRINAVPVDCERLLERCISLLWPLALQAEVTMNLQPATAGVGPAMADETHLKGVLINLLANAIKYNSRPGRVEVSVQRAADGRIAIAIRDTGQGMSRDEIETVFNAFSRLERNQSIEGSGIGLTVTRRLVEEMGGAIEVESEVGVGSTFTVLLPVAAGEPVAKGVAEGGVEGAVSAQTTHEACRLLVAEDDRTNRMVIEIMLKRLGYPHDFAEDGAEAVARWRQGGYELILMDINMPNLDGVEATRQIRQAEGQGSHIPIIALTANVIDEEVERYYAAGVDRWLPKPVDFTVLERLLREQFAGTA